MNSQPSSAIENGLTSQLIPTVTAMPRQCSLDLPERGEVDLEQHRNDHQPDQHGDRQIDFRHRRRAERVEHGWACVCPRPMPTMMQSATQSVR